MYDLKKVIEGFRFILEGLGIPIDEHTKDTAQRAARAWWNELCVGLRSEPPVITSFPSDVDEMVVLQGIPVHSICAHHLLPFVGTAAVAYIPGTGRLLGLSKLSRLVDHLSRRPQVQEELTNQIANAMADLVIDGDSGGVGVFVRAKHMCMSLRGVKHGGLMTTTALRGAILNEAAARDEFLRVISQGENKR